MALVERRKLEDKAEYYRAGIIASTIANVNRKRKKPFKPEDFMPIAKNVDGQTPEQMAQIMDIFAGEVNNG